MKNKEVISSVVGASFFALGYLGLAVNLPLSLALGVTSFVASELIVTSGKKKITEIKELSFKEKIDNARRNNEHIKKMINEFEDEETRTNLDEIVKSTSKIINTIEKNKLKNATSDKFFEYYLPVCVKIVDKYDDIENQKLTSHDSKMFINDSKSIIKDANKSFKKILNSLYQSDITNAEAEMKVFNSILKADGYDEGILESGDDNE